MHKQKRIRDYGLQFGKFETGKLNSITDVKGVRVGHVTIDRNDIKTGVTSIIPHPGDTYQEKLVAASHIINGYGKSCGLMQINELGQLETPILLTNTLNVGLVSDALIDYMLRRNEEIGTKDTVNPVVCECNDSYLNRIRHRNVNREHVFEVLKSASEEFLEGDVGAGKGMKCFGYKGGIGTSSRKIKINNEEFTIGVLVLTNFGKKEDLIINHKNIKTDDDKSEDKGSIIFIVATDIPLSHRQLQRVIKRCNIGLGRLGSFMGNGSGEVVVGFSTANKIMKNEKEATIPFKIFNENKIDDLFRATALASEEAILNSMITANTVIGRDGHKVESLKHSINQYI